MGSRSLRPVGRSAFLTLLGLNALLRCYLGTLPGYVGDFDLYKEWALGSARSGIAAAYEQTTLDYPPLFLYALHPVGEAYLALHPEIRNARVERARWGELFFHTRDGRVYRTRIVRPGVPRPGLEVEVLPDSTLFTLLVKVPLFFFDLFLGVLLFGLVAWGGLWGAARRGPGWGRLAMLLYLWNPAVLWCSGYWGQADSIHSALALSALALLAFGRPFASGALLAAAGLMKPLAAPLVPLWALAVSLRRGLPGLAAAGFGGLAASLLVFLPFLATGRLLPVLDKVLLDVEVMPFTSVNAHNLWWILGPWQNADASLLAFLTPRHVGLSILALAYGLLLFRMGGWAGRNRDEDSFRAGLFLNAAAVVGTFFFVSTHMHENHLFMAVPLLLCVAGRGPHLAWLALGCSVGTLLNMLLHDPELMARFPSLLGSLGGDPRTRPRPGFLQAASYANSLLLAAVACGTYLAAWRKPSLTRGSPAP